MLYGSYATGTETSKSDIDLLIVVSAKKPLNYLKKVIAKISRIDVEGKISPRLTNIKDHDPSFFQNVFREGKLLYGEIKMKPKDMDLKPHILITYNLTNLSESKKVKISRAVYGYTSKKTYKGKLKEYHYPGLKDRTKAIIISNSVILLPEKDKLFINFLDRENVKYKITKNWLEKEPKK